MMTKKRFSFFLFVIFILCQGFIWAQNTKKRVTNAADLPGFSYDVPEKLIDLLNDDVAYKLFEAKVRADLEGVLRDYEIEDKTTLKRIQTTLAELDFQENRLDSALERMRVVGELETKPEFKYLPDFFDIQIIARAQKQSGAASGEKFTQALRLVLAKTLNALPDSVFDGVKEFRTAYDFTNEKFATNIIEGQLAPIAKRNGNKLFDKEAHQIISLRTIQRFVVPLTGEFAKGFDAFIAAHKPSAKINIWTSRTVTLTGKEKLAPVIIAVWDTGVDPTVFPNQMFVNVRERSNGKDNDGNGFAADIYGIGFDEKGKFTSAPHFAPSDADLKQFPEWVKERRVSQQLIAGIETEETRALKLKWHSETTEQSVEQRRLSNVYSTYNHGTAVAGVAVAGNPAARILNARLTWRDLSGQPDSVAEDAERAGRIAANIKTFVDYFKKHNVRVVNMSWSLSRTSIDENLAKTKPTLTAQERKIEADKSFTIIKNALVEAFRSAPEILFTCSAGNTGSDAGFNESIPSSLEMPNLITVGAVDASGAAANFTSFGKTVRLYAQGVDVEAPNPGGEKLKFGGTSFAAPQTANLAAKLFALNPKLTVAQVVKLIQDGADASVADKRLKLINPKRSAELLVSMKK